MCINKPSSDTFLSHHKNVKSITRGTLRDQKLVVIFLFKFPLEKTSNACEKVVKLFEMR